MLVEVRCHCLVTGAQARRDSTTSRLYSMVESITRYWCVQDKHVCPDHYFVGIPGYVGKANNTHSSCHAHHMLSAALVSAHSPELLTQRDM